MHGSGSILRMLSSSGTTFKIIVVVVLKLSVFVHGVKSLGCSFCVSIWDPFCKEEVLFAPYVRVFQKGRPGALLRDRGPGFIDVTGMQDIYICTNGLVMLYYMKTRGMGEVYEHGELHWAPHHCELYNPSCNNGMPGDFPRKTLLSILLIGHPQDYRRPALQMFVAPTFDEVYGDYINITSLIMVGSDGECLIEKGAERARLRVRVKEPTSMKNVTGEKPAVFCQLDSQRKLGQRGIINLAMPGEVSTDPSNATLFTLPVRDPNATFKGSPYERLGKHQRSETGPAISPRYRATRYPEMFPDSMKFLAQAADDVYTALINDRKMRFVGCLRYPDFSAEQYRVIYTRFQEGNFTKEMNLTGVINDAAEFWADEVKPPWPVKPDPAAEPGSTLKKRFELYGMKDVETEGYPSYQDAKADLDDAIEELKKARLNNSETDVIREKEYNVTQQQMLFGLWPLKKGYEAVYKYLIALRDEVSTVWEKIIQAAAGEMAPDADGISTHKPPNFEEMENEDNKPNQLAQWRYDLLKNISQAKYDRRFEPYNRQLVNEYNNYTKTNAKLVDRLKKTSIDLGPMISNAETLHSRFRVFHNLLKKASSDLRLAVKHLEKKGKPLEPYSGKHPMETFFLDTMIEIADAAENETTPAEGEAAPPPKINPGKACFVLPSRNGLNKILKKLVVRPTSVRAYQILRTRQGKGKSFETEDLWRQKVLDVIEEIFVQVCPYISQDFASSVNRILKGYLLAEPLGTGLKEPVIGTRLSSNDHNYQAIVYNMTYNQTHVKNHTDGFEGTLRFMDPFWEQIQIALEDCKLRAKPMQFWHAEEGDKPVVISFRKFFPNNNSEAYFDVDELLMLEKADLEYSFNWAIDMNWRIFATVLGVCMPAYEKTIPLISARFYALYSNDFLYPLRQIWMSNRDNPVHSVILGNYLGRGKAEKWAKVCMESSFVESGDRNYRPPRNLFVNAFTEMNYFVTGPLAGTSGILSVASGINR